MKRWSDLQAFAPNIVIGSLHELQRLADQASAGGFDPSAIDRALILLTRHGGRPLTDRARVMLWQTFGVPIFELYLSLDHSLLASECEAHEGWHLAPGVEAAILGSGEVILDGAGNAGLRTGLCASVDLTGCPCGHAGPRLLEITPLHYSGARYLAASA